MFYNFGAKIVKYIQTDENRGLQFGYIFVETFVWFGDFSYLCTKD